MEYITHPQQVNNIYDNLHSTQVCRRYCA